MNPDTTIILWRIKGGTFNPLRCRMAFLKTIPAVVLVTLARTDPKTNSDMPGRRPFPPHNYGSKVIHMLGHCYVHD